MRIRFVATLGASLALILASGAQAAGQSESTSTASVAAGPVTETAPPTTTGGDQTGTVPPSPDECPAPIAVVRGLSLEPRARFRGRVLHRGDTLSRPGIIAVARRGWVRLGGAGPQLRLGRGRLRLACSGPPLLLDGTARPTGAVSIQSRQALLTSKDRTLRATVTVTSGLSRVWLYAGSGRISRASGSRGTALMLHPGDLALVRTGGAPQLDTWPFALPPGQRRTMSSDRLPAFWNDGQRCSTGCRPAGAITGWPIKPFHAQHGLRAGLNERRRANMHRGVDIQARDGTPVYAVQSGTASVAGEGSVDERVQVGNYIYWHVRRRVRAGQRVEAYKTVVGTVIRTAGHVHFSEVSGGRYLNPLRPGGRVLGPWADSDAPIIHEPIISRDGRGFHAVVEVFDPQSYRELVKYRTPVLAPAALAYRAFDARGRDVTGLRWSLRGSQHYPDGDRFVIYAHGAHTRGWSCFAVRLTCRPLWKYRLTDGLTPAIPSSARRISIYAYDWAGNVSVRESPL